MSGKDRLPNVVRDSNAASDGKHSKVTTPPQSRHKLFPKPATTSSASASISLGANRPARQCSRGLPVADSYTGKVARPPPSRRKLFQGPATNSFASASISPGSRRASRQCSRGYPVTESCTDKARDHLQTGVTNRLPMLVQGGRAPRDGKSMEVTRPPQSRHKLPVFQHPANGSSASAPIFLGENTHTRHFSRGLPTVEYTGKARDQHKMSGIRWLPNLANGSNVPRGGKSTKAVSKKRAKRQLRRESSETRTVKANPELRESERADTSTFSDEADKDLIDKVTAKSKANLRRFCGILCGLRGSGKSSLCRALFGDEFIPKLDSSREVAAQRTFGLLSDGSDRRTSLFVRVRDISDLYNKLAADHLRKRPHYRQLPQDSGIPHHTDEKNSNSVQGSTNTSPPSVVKGKNSGNSPDGAEMNRACVELYDRSGEMTMTIPQSICVDTTRSFFLLLFDVRKGLDEVVAEEDMCRNNKEIPIPKEFKGMTHRQFLQQNLTAISLRQQRQSVGGSQPGEGKCSKPTQVFLIGSHIDKVTGDPQETISAVRKAITEMSEKSNGAFVKLKGPYFTDNRRIGDSVSKYSNIKELQEDIKEAVCSAPADDIPLTWLKMEDELCTSRKCSNGSAASMRSSTYSADGTLTLKTHLTYKEFLDRAKFLTNNEMSNAEASAALTYYHQLGSVICTNYDRLTPDSHIFLNTGWMLQQFVKLVTSNVREDLLSPRQLDLAPDVKKLRECGVLTEALLNCLWSHLEEKVRASLISTLCYFDLACLISPTKDPKVEEHSASSQGRTSKGPSYLIPFCTAHGECSASLPPGSSVLPALVLHFHSLFPPAIFSQVSVHCIEHFKAVDPAMDFSAISFNVDIDHHIRISWIPIGLKIELCSFDDDRMSAAQLGHRLLHFIETCLQKLMLQTYGGLEWEPAFCCNTCKMKCRDRDIAAPNAWTSLRRQTVEKLQQRTRESQNSFETKCSACMEFTKLPEDFFFYWLAKDDDINGQVSRQAEPCYRARTCGEEDAAAASHESGLAGYSQSAHSCESVRRSSTSTVISERQRKSSEDVDTLERDGKSRSSDEDFRLCLASGEKVVLPVGRAASACSITVNNFNISRSELNFPAAADDGCGGMALQGIGSIIQRSTVFDLNSMWPDGQTQLGTLSKIQIERLCRSETVQAVYQDVICALPDSNGQSHFSKRQVKQMKDSACRTSNGLFVPMKCLFESFRQWSLEVEDGVTLLMEIMSDPGSAWKMNLSMAEARPVILNILQNDRLAAATLKVMDGAHEDNMASDSTSAQLTQPRLSLCQIEELSRSETVQAVYQDVICALPDSNGQSLFSKRQVKQIELTEMDQGTIDDSCVVQRCLYDAFSLWSYTVRNGAALLKKSMQDLNCKWWHTSRMTEARSVMEDILQAELPLVQSRVMRLPALTT